MTDHESQDKLDAMAIWEQLSRQGVLTPAVKEKLMADLDAEIRNAPPDKEWLPAAQWLVAWSIRHHIVDNGWLERLSNDPALNGVQ